MLTGWYVTEIGRQPWVIQDVLRTSDAVSQSLTGTEATATLLVFVVVYVGLITAALLVLRRLIRDELRDLGVFETPRATGYGRIPWVGGDD